MAHAAHAHLTNDAEKAIRLAPHQHFHYDGTYITALDGRVVDVKGNSTEAGAKVQCFDKKPGNHPNQQWDLKDGSFYSRVGNNLVLDIQGGNVANGSEIITWAHHGGPNQKWDIDSAGYIRSRANNKFVLDLNGGAGKGAGKLTLWQGSASLEQTTNVSKLKGANHQRWHYDAKSGHITGFDGRVLDVKGNSKEQGAKVQVFDRKPGNELNQQWDYKDGAFYSRLAGFVLDIQGGNIANGTELIVWAHHGGPHQKWDVDQWGFIRSRANPKFGVDVNGATAGKGSGKISLWTINF